MKNDTVHVVYIITKMELGGAQKVCLSLAEGVDSKGLNTTLISGAEGVLVSEAKKLKSTYLLDSLQREFSLKMIWGEIKTFFNIIKILKTLKKNHTNLIVHTHSTKAGIIGRWAAFFAGVKNRVHTIHGFGFNDFQPKIKWAAIFFVEYITSLVTTHFVCVSQKDREFGVKKFPKFAQKSSIIRAAAEWERFYIPAKLDNYNEQGGNDKFIIGTISCFKPQKNLFGLLNAFKMMYLQLTPDRQAAVQLQIIGDGVMRVQIEEWIKFNNLGEKIELLGWQKDTSKFMKKWNVFALSSLWEGLPIAVIEARLCKLPVVAYDVGGVFEVVFNNKNGFLIPPKNIDLMAQKFSLLVQSPDLAARMGDFNDELYEFKDDVMIQRHVDLYKKL